MTEAELPPAWQVPASAPAACFGHENMNATDGLVSTLALHCLNACPLYDYRGRFKYKVGTLGSPTTKDPCVGLLVRTGDPPIALREC